MNHTVWWKQLLKWIKAWVWLQGICQVAIWDSLLRDHPCCQISWWTFAKLQCFDFFIASFRNLLIYLLSSVSTTEVLWSLRYSASSWHCFFFKSQNYFSTEQDSVGEAIFLQTRVEIKMLCFFCEICAISSLCELNLVWSDSPSKEELLASRGISEEESEVVLNAKLHLIVHLALNILWKSNSLESSHVQHVRNAPVVLWVTWDLRHHPVDFVFLLHALPLMETLVCRIIACRSPRMTVWMAAMVMIVTLIISVIRLVVHVFEF